MGLRSAAPASPVISAGVARAAAPGLLPLARAPSQTPVTAYWRGSKADLTGAQLVGANLTRAQLKEADLTHAQLYGANLTGALGLTQAQVEAAFGDAATRLPTGLERPASWTADQQAVADAAPASGARWVQKLGRHAATW
jgi:uncharacterized protein (DUF2126 family)